MKALVVASVGQLEIREVERPQIGPYQALVQIEMCGICTSTDQKLIEGKMSWAPPFPFVLGHESVGRVVQIGEKVSKFQIGDRVTRPIFPGAGDLGSAMGGFAEFGIVSDADAMMRDGDFSLQNDYNATRQMVVPSQLSALEGALAISLSETASVVSFLPEVRGQRVLVAGTGIAGLAFAHWLHRAGAHVTVLGRRESRLQKAREMGAIQTLNTRENGWENQLATLGPFDGALEATGDADLAEKLLWLLKPEGFAVAYGVPPKGTQYNPRWENARVEEHQSFGQIVALLGSGELKAKAFSPRIWEFEDVVEAFESAARGEHLKSLVRMGH